MSDLLVVLVPEMAGLVITPGAIVGTILLLRSPRPVVDAAMFGAAFVALYTLIAVTALLGGASDPGSTPPAAAHWVGLCVGVLFLVCGVWVWLRRPVKTARPDRPKLLQELAAATPAKAFVIGITLAVLNPNLFLMISGMTAISSSHVGTAAAVAATIALLIAAALDFAVPITVFVVLGQRARDGLDRAEVWMLAHARVLSLTVLFAFGALFTVRGALALL
ncbi:GAP family protein [Nocardia sp. NPDC001965]